MLVALSLDRGRLDYINVIARIDADDVCSQVVMVYVCDDEVEIMFSSRDGKLCLYIYHTYIVKAAPYIRPFHVLSLGLPGLPT